MRRLVLLLALLHGACSRSVPSAVDRLHPCQIEEGPPDAYCGQLTVFENRKSRQGRTIDLKIVVAPALRRDFKPDPLFVFEGGPGGGAATLAAYRLPLFKRFQIDRDIVLIDQRGTGASNPLECEPPDPEAEDLATIGDYPVERFKRCLETLKADPTLYTTSIAMDDIDDVRQFLGYATINLWGGSYGTRAALVYLKQHEASVRSVVLDGVAPPDMRLPLYVARDGQRALDRLIESCAAEPGCAREFPKLRESIEALWMRVDSRPTAAIVHPRTGRSISFPLSRRLVASIVFQSLYSPEITALLPRLLTDASEGRFQGLMSLAFTQELPKGAMSEGMFLSVVCAEDVPRITEDDIARETTGRFFATVLFDTQVKPCAFWPHTAVPDDYYAPVASSKPVAIFSGANDPITPPTWGEHVAQSLPNSRHFVVPGAGHITLPRGCVPQLVAKFLASARTDELDGACLEKLRRPPFFTTYTGPAPQ
jgi:pimeloyl-ACP methyl ester carboxylesterase